MVGASTQPYAPETSSMQPQTLPAGVPIGVLRLSLRFPPVRAVRATSALSSSIRRLAYVSALARSSSPFAPRTSNHRDDPAAGSLAGAAAATSFSAPTTAHCTAHPSWPPAESR